MCKNKALIFFFSIFSFLSWSQKKESENNLKTFWTTCLYVVGGDSCVSIQIEDTCFLGEFCEGDVSFYSSAWNTSNNPHTPHYQNYSPNDMSMVLSPSAFIVSPSPNINLGTTSAATSIPTIVNIDVPDGTTQTLYVNWGIGMNTGGSNYNYPGHVAEIIIHGNPIVDAGPDLSYCPSSGPLTLNPIAPSTSNTYQWFDQYGNALSGLGPATSISVAPTGNTFYILEATNDYGCIGSDTVHVSIDLPNYTTVTSNFPLCHNSSSSGSLFLANANFGISIPIMGGSFLWTDCTNNPNLASLPNGNAFNYIISSISPPGTYSMCLEWTSPSGCVANEIFTFDILPSLDVSPLNGLSYCPNSGLQLLPTLNASSSFSYSGSGISHVNGQWFFNATLPGTYPLSACNGSCCSDFDITVLPPLNMGNIHILGVPMCGQATLIGDMSALNASTNVCWYEQSNPGICLGINSQITVYNSGTYCVRGFDAQGCRFKKCISVTIDQPTQVYPLDSIDSICVGNSIILAHKSIFSGSQGAWISDQFYVDNIPAIGGVTTTSGTGLSLNFSWPFSQTVFEGLNSNIGWNEIAYTYTDVNGCESQSTMNIYVIPYPTGTIDPIANVDLCSDSQPFLPLFSNNDPNAIETLTANQFTTTTTSLGYPIFNTVTGEFDPLLAGPGEYNIHYHVSNQCGSYSTQSLFEITEEENWHQTTKNSSSNEVVNDVVTDAFGNVYVVGSFIEETVLNGGWNGAGNPDITISAPILVKNTFLAKYNACGGLIWAANATSHHENVGNAITIDEVNGKIYVAGYMSDYIELNSAQSSIVATGSTSILLTTTAIKGYVAQYDMLNGELNFVNDVNIPIQNGGTSYTEVRAITVNENNGDIYVGGRRCNGAFNGSSSDPRYGYFVNKYIPSSTSLNTAIWSEYQNNYFHDQVNDIDFDEIHDRVWLIGNFNKYIGHNTGVVNGFNDDAFIGSFRGINGASVSVSGVSSWRSGGSSAIGIMRGNGVSVDETSGIPYFVGSYKNNDIADPFKLVSASMTSDILPGNLDAFRAYFIKFDLDNMDAWVSYARSFVSPFTFVNIPPFNVYGKGISVKNNKINFCGDTYAKRTQFIGSSNALPINLGRPQGGAGSNVYTGAVDMNGQVFNNLNLAYGMRNIQSMSMTTDNQGHSFYVGSYNRDLRVINALNFISQPPTSGTMNSTPFGAQINGFVLRGDLSNGYLKHSQEPDNNGFDYESNLGNFEVYPNPFGSKLNIQRNDDRGESYYFAVYDAMGSCIRQIENVKSISHEFELTAVPTGIYFIKINSEQGTEVIKLIKK